MKPLDALQVEMVSPADLTPYSRNARTHSPEQIELLVNSIKQFGFTTPVLIDVSGRIIAGHGRVKAAQKLGRLTIPAIRLEHLDETNIKALTIADNRIASLAGWDFDVLAAEIDELTDCGFDTTLLGFSQEELDELIGTPEVPEEEEKQETKDTCICPKCHFEFIP